MSIVKRFRFGVQHYPASSRREWQENARRAEALGYDVFLMPDHIGQGGLAWAPALMAAAEATSTLRIGTLVLANDFRHPALLASEAATLDQLSDGRFELGLGAGWDQRDYDFAGIPFDRPGIRVSRLEESVRVIKELLAGSEVTFNGEHYAITSLQSAPSTYQHPHPPLMIGGGGAGVLSIAAREADIVSVMPPGVGSGVVPDLNPESMARNVERVHERAGERINQIELSILLQRLFITDDPHAAAQGLADQWGLSVDEAVWTPWALIGTVDQIIETLQERRDQYGLSYWVVHGWYMEDFAPIVAGLTGK